LNIIYSVSSPRKEFKYSDIPGPGYYKIPGFTDVLLHEVERLLRNRKMPELPKVEKKQVKKNEILEEDEEI
jgi:hypothetical protein